MNDDGLDPGRFWRRMARWGALLCTAATLIPYDRKILWQYAFSHLSGWWREVDTYRGYRYGWLAWGKTRCR